MISSLLSKIFGTPNDRYLKSFEATISKISSLESRVEKLSDSELKECTQKFKDRLTKNESLDDILPEAFAVVREAGKRVLGQRHYDVQMIGGIVLHKGMIAEMKTGEGKTLVATLPAYLNALSGKGVHVVTVNDYLVKRDALGIGRVYEFLGLTVSYIINTTSEEERRDAYQADITYVTNNELGFDYLRDNMKYSLDQCVQRPFNYVIVDEVDSILIDEARTPLIISGPSDDHSELYYVADKLVKSLDNTHYEIDEKSKQVSLTDQGINVIEGLLLESKTIKPESSLFDIDNINILHHINQSLKANHLFKNNVDYLVKDHKVMIIDEFTGRIMDGRRFSDGLHQALEAKENVPVQNENQTLASITYQNYFRLYNKLSGMTGTAATEAAEFQDIYKLNVVSIPTKNPLIRKDEDDLIYRTEKEKYDAIVDEIVKSHSNQQPVLVGTISIERSEYISDLLKKRKVPHNILNAKYHEREAFIIAQAGRPSTVTIATNMAGRGTDIMLGGNAEMLARENAQNEEEYLESLQKFHDQVKQDKEVALKAGGLLVIGTERHESRRIDNQLRGRSGRMGDPGRSIFYLSLQDDLMRIFASEKISSILKTLGLKEGEAIFHSMISRTIEKAQQKVEMRNYEVRKNLLKFDDVMNDQRKIVYEQRHQVMSSDNVNQTVSDIYEDFNKEVLQEYIPDSKYREEWDIEGLGRRLVQVYGSNMDIVEFMNADHNTADIENYISAKASEILKKKQKDFGDALFNSAEKRLLLVTIDHVWKDHLLSLDHLKQGIYLRSFAQKDPLNEYKKEAFESFGEMLTKIRELYLTRIMHMQIASETDHEILSDDFAPTFKMKESRTDPAFAQLNANEELNKKVGRNELCPCGSNKKYKHCHGKI